MFKCQFSDCEKFYTSKYSLQRHCELKHIRTKRFRCRICGKHLSSKQNLNEHTYTHSKVRPYLCKEPNCAKTFRQKSQLSNHKKFHMEMKRILGYNEFKELKLTSLSFQELVLENIVYEKFTESKILLPSITVPQRLVFLPKIPFKVLN